MAGIMAGIMVGIIFNSAIISAGKIAIKTVIMPQTKIIAVAGKIINRTTETETKSETAAVDLEKTVNKF